jgi:thioredoxin reductase
MENAAVDITILGGGPTGLFAAFYAGLRDASCRIIDSLPSLGGRLTAVYPEKYIYDVAGFPKILAGDLVANLIQQIEPYQTSIQLSQMAQGLTKRENGLWEIQTQTQSYLTRTLIIAGGVGQYSPKWHSAPGANAFYEKGIYYGVMKKTDYAGKNILVLGGGDSALDWANEFVALGCKVTLAHRTDAFRAHADSLNKFKATHSTILTNVEVKEFKGDNCLTSVILHNETTDTTTELKVDCCFVFFGFNSSLGKLKEFGLDLEGNRIKVNSKMETNLPGVFAAGDITHYPGKLDLIVTGFSEAAIAANMAKNFINPKEKIQPMHSTTIAEIKEKKKQRS